MTTWDRMSVDERIAVVRAAVRPGQSYAQACAALGIYMREEAPSRASLLGLVNRNRGAFPPNLFAGRRPGRLTHLSTPRPPALRRLPGTLPRGRPPRRPPVPLQTSTSEPDPALAVSFHKYRRGRECNHPLWSDYGRVEVDDMMVCGAPCADGREQCPHHIRAYYGDRL